MATPTITTIGASNGLLLITDHEGTVKRIPKASISSIVDSSNQHVDRISITHTGIEFVLLFDNAAEVAAFLSDVDDEY